MKGWGFHKLKYIKGYRKMCHFGLSRGPKGLTDVFYSCEKSRKCSGFVIYSYRRVPKISPFKYKPPKPVTQKKPPLNRTSKYKPPWACTWKIALKCKVKQNGRFPSNYKASPIDFET